MDKFKIESHKLGYHAERVNDWLKGKRTYPIYLEIAPSGACNHRCTYCALDFMEYKPAFLETDLIKKRISEMALLGVKSIMFAGEGEPLLHHDIADIVAHTKNAGIDVAITTNGVLLKKESSERILANVTWLKVSMDAASQAVYQKIHNAHPDDFNEVIKNISDAVTLRERKKHKCTLGIQLLLLPENSGEIMKLVKRAKALGVDYVVIKPYSYHPFTRTNRYKNVDYKKWLPLSDAFDNLNTDKFNVIFRAKTMRKWNSRFRGYKLCYALPFWAYIDARGNVWGCSTYLTDNRFLYGNIHTGTFQKIWNDSEDRRAMIMAGRNFDIKHCRINCRMDEANQYLWELKNPSRHVNFI